MHPLLADKKEQIAELCKRRHVSRLDAFGSVTSIAFDPQRSDVDLLVEFVEPMPANRFETYFALKYDLEALLGVPVDLVEPGGIRNPVIRESIFASTEQLYAA